MMCCFRVTLLVIAFGYGLALAGDEVARLLNGAHELLEKGEVANAHKEFDRVIALEPKCARAYLGRAACWMAKGEPKKALTDYDRGIQLETAEPKYFVGRGAAHMALGEWKKAEADFDDAIRLDPKYTLAFRNRGVLWMQLEEWDKSLRDFNEALRLDPRDASALKNRGALRMYQCDWAAAFKDFDAALALTPNDAIALSNRAYLRACCPDAVFRDGAKAVADATACCEAVNWKRGSYLAILAAAHAESGDFKSAVKWQKKALEDPRFRDSENILVTTLELYEQEKAYRLPAKKP